MSFHWLLFGEALCSTDNHLASHLMCGCDNVWDASVCDSANFFLRLADIADVINNKMIIIHYFVLYSLHVHCTINSMFIMRT